MTDADKKSKMLTKKQDRFYVMRLAFMVFAEVDSGSAFYFANMSQRGADSPFLF